MSQQHILRLNQKGEPILACHFDDENKRSHETVVNGWPAVDKGKQWTLLLPASWVYQTQTTVPSKSTEVLKQSIPYAVEEELSNDVEDNHFAFKVTGEQEQRVAVLSLGYLAQLKQSVQHHKIKTNHLLSEVAFCPKKADTAVIWVHGEQALLCLGEGETLSITREQVSDMLPVFAADLDYIQSNEEIDESWLSSGLVSKPNYNLSACFEALASGNSVNLMPANWLKSNDDKAPKHNNKLWALVVMLVVSWVGIKTFQHISINHQIDELKSRQLSLFTGRFGDASGSELLDPYAALKSRMQRVSQSQSTTSPLLVALNYLGQAVENHRSQIEIQSLRLVERKLEIQITAETMTLINRFQQSLQQAAMEFKVMIGVNEQDAGRFRSVITMEKL